MAKEGNIVTLVIDKNDLIAPINESLIKNTTSTGTSAVLT